MSTHALELRDRQVQTSMPGGGEGDLAFQNRILPAVSRTFALTIPELPAAMVPVVANGYLLCRIADTVEDDPGLDLEEKRHFHALFGAAVRGEADPAEFAAELAPRLTEHTLLAERELAARTASVVRLTHSFAPLDREALSRCVTVMCDRMPRFQTDGHGRLVGREARGLADTAEYHDYCYAVAGVVGEMLTDLFCNHSPAVAANRAALEARAVSFGQGLQMTNILKDIWDDLERGFCWLPSPVFRAHGFELESLPDLAADPNRRDGGFEAGLGDLLAIGHGHLRRALEYTLAIPASERGIRRFCLWALGMAVLTLRRIDRNRGYRTSSEVKITRQAVRGTVVASNLAIGSDALLRFLFRLGAHGLPAPPAIEQKR